jgi:hypothetical protein
MTKTPTAPEMKREGCEREPGEHFEKSDTGPASVQSMVKIDDDFHGWLLAQASALRQQHYSLLDWDHLADELEATAARDGASLKSVLRTFCFICLRPMNYIATIVGEVRCEKRANRLVISLKICPVFFKGSAMRSWQAPTGAPAIKPLMIPASR